MMRIYKYVKNQSGQSLIEIMVALAIGAVLIGAAIVGIAFILRSRTLNESSRTATSLHGSLLEKIRAYSNSSWNDFYDLGRNDINEYFIAPSGVGFLAVRGVEGMVPNATAEGLMLHWKLDNASTTNLTVYDFSGHGLEGLVNTKRFASDCRVGGCLSFTSAEAVGLINDPFNTLDFVDGVTVSAWVRPTSLPLDSAGVAAGGGYGITHEDDGNIRFFAGGGGDALSVPSPLGEWHHVTGVASTTELYLYVDGALRATSTTATAMFSGDGFGVGSGFAGEIDDVRVYGRALTQIEINSLARPDIFRRYFYLQDVERGSEGEIGVGALDPSTLEVLVRVEWTPQEGGDRVFEIRDFVTRWRNEVFHQTDWSEGLGLDDPQNQSEGEYLYAENIRFTPGAIQIDGIIQ